MTSPQAVTFYCAQRYAQFGLKSGALIPFIDHLFKTSDKSKIAELQAEVDLGHPLISVATQEQAMSALDETDIMGSLRERVRREIIAEERAKLAAAGDKSNDLGTYQAPQVMAASNSNEAAGVLEAAAAAQVDQVQTSATPAASRAKLAALIAK
jgi:hypothetical protein